MSIKTWQKLQAYKFTEEIKIANKYVKHAIYVNIPSWLIFSNLNWHGG